MLIIPALITEDNDLTNDFEELKTKFEKIRPYLAEFDHWIQIDITDGKFVETKTVLNLDDLKYFTEKASVDFHLMTENPESSLDDWLDLSPKRITVHIEAAKDVQSIIDKCRNAGVEVGLALNPETPNTDIEPWISLVNVVLYMSIHPGKGGQQFIPSVLAKISELRQKYPDTKIGVDGGIKKENIGQLKKAGIDVFVIGSGILSAPDTSQVIVDFKNALLK